MRSVKLDPHSTLTRPSLDAHSTLTRTSLSRPSLNPNSTLTRLSLDACSTLTRTQALALAVTLTVQVSANSLAHAGTAWAPTVAASITYGCR